MQTTDVRSILKPDLVSRLQKYEKVGRMSLHKNILPIKSAHDDGVSTKILAVLD